MSLCLTFLNTLDFPAPKAGKTTFIFGELTRSFCSAMKVFPSQKLVAHTKLANGAVVTILQTLHSFTHHFAYTCSDCSSVRMSLLLYYRIVILFKNFKYLSFVVSSLAFSMMEYISFPLLLWLKTTQTYHLRVLEVRSPNLGHHQGCSPSGEYEGGSFPYLFQRSPLFLDLRLLAPSSKPRAYVASSHLSLWPLLLCHISNPSALIFHLSRTLWLHWANQAEVMESKDNKELIIKPKGKKSFDRIALAFLV